MTQWIITTDSGHQWLIEDAVDKADALAQYYDGEAETHQQVDRLVDMYPDDAEDHADYLRDMGQAS